MFESILEYYKDDKQVNDLYQWLEQRLRTVSEINYIEWDNRLQTISSLYYYLYCTPLFEALRKSDKLNELIYSHFSFCLLARFQDNILDDDFEVFSKTESMRLSNSLLSEAKQSFLNTGLIWDQRINKVFNDFYDYEDELLKSMVIDNTFLYRRVSFLMVVPEALAEGIGNHFLTPYKYYLNYCLLFHDMADMLNDIKKMKRSFITDKFEIRGGFYETKTSNLFKETSETLNYFTAIIKKSSIKNNFFEVAFINASKNLAV